MPRYFFDLHDGFDVVDDVGIELRDATAARDHARRLVAEYAADPANYDANGTLVIVTRDGSSSVISTVRLVLQEQAA